ncbi:hypothetical protein M5K25_021909 [Dendrobium thyrsiflorum]|uniref:Uncharacterized protein n=1 Tax=Dendrobium thyrsiflorum TaxID=117978 RepID=A0ABD0U5G9_DENTH
MASPTQNQRRKPSASVIQQPTKVHYSLTPHSYLSPLLIPYQRPSPATHLCSYLSPWSPPESLPSLPNPRPSPPPYKPLSSFQSNCSGMATSSSFSNPQRTQSIHNNGSVEEWRGDVMEGRFHRAASSSQRSNELHRSESVTSSVICCEADAKALVREKRDLN